MGNALIIAEHADGQLKKATRNVITFARDLCQRRGIGYDIAVIGQGVDSIAAEASRYGAENVFTVDGDAWANYLAQPFANSLGDLAAETEADYIITSAGTFGKDLMPRVACQLVAGLVADCIGLAGDDEILFKRPMYAGNIIATVRAHTDPVAITVRTTEFDAAEPGDGNSTITKVDADPGTSHVRFVSMETTKSERPELTDAEVVVSGGRGLKDGSRFYEVMEPLADALGAAIGASRAAVDSWEEVPNDLQVGQTGKVVAPNLYVAVAISGAIQHLAGMKASKTIVAINTNGDEPIFQVADYGLVADAFKAVPELVQKLN